MTQDEAGAQVGPGATPGPHRLLPLTVAVALAAVGMWGVAVPAAGVGLLDLPTSDAFVRSLPLVGALLFLAFLAAEGAQIHLPVRRWTFSVSLSELPLVIGLFLAPPLLLLSARLSAYACVAVVLRVKPGTWALNTGLFAAEVGLAVAVFHQLAGGRATTLASWAAAYAAASSALVLGAIVVSAGMRLVQPPFSLGQALRMSAPGFVTGLFTTTLGLLIVILVVTAPYSSLGLLVVGGVLVVAFRRFGRLVSDHKDLEALYELTREVSTSLRGPTVDEALLERVRVLMRAEVAQLWLSDGDQLVAKPADGPPIRTRSPEDAVRRRVIAGASTLAGPRTREPAIREALAQRGVRELVAVPLRVGGEVVGCLEVADRQGERSRFAAADRALLETLAVHTGVALENTRLVARLRHEADHDPLTGLPNRKAFVERLDAALATTPPGRQVAVLVLDLQSFKDVNDTLGRAAGDQLLVEIASRVGVASRGPWRVARLSSDELGMCLPVTDVAAAREAAAELQNLLAVPIVLDNVEIEVGGVVGIALYPEHGDDAVTLVQRADVAMYAAKKTSRGVLAYTPAMDAPSVRRFGLVAELRRALEAGDLLVWYQPQVQLERSELVGLEALVRWKHPEHGFVPPDEFVPIAEHTGLIGPLTSFVLGRALGDLAEWRRHGHEFGMSVNMSVRSLLDPGFADEVQACLAGAGVPPSLLTLEITESGVMSDPDRAVPVLERLRDMGVRLSVDDFGIGHSSLTYLRRLPVAEVKIDRSFVSQMVHSPGDLAIVRAVIDLSRPMGLSVVAEGVESEETQQELARLGCAVIQGYLLSRPLARADMDRWIARRTVTVPAGQPGPHRWLRVVTG